MKKCIDTKAVKAGVVCGFKREGEECDRCEETARPFFLDGDFNNSYESRIRASKSKNIVHDTRKKQSK